MILKIIFSALIAILIFCIEQVLGLPVLFFAIVLWFSHTLNPVGRQILLFVGGLMIGLVYHVPLAGGWLLMVLLALAWNASQDLIKSDTARLLVLSLIGTGVVAVVSRFEWTTGATISVAISLALTVIFAQTVFFISNSAGRLRLRPSIRLIKQGSL